METKAEIKKNIIIIIKCLKISNSCVSGEQKMLRSTEKIFHERKHTDPKITNSLSLQIRERPSIQKNQKKKTENKLYKLKFQSTKTIIPLLSLFFLIIYSLSHTHVRVTDNIPHPLSLSTWT